MYLASRQVTYEPLEGATLVTLDDVHAAGAAVMKTASMRGDGMRYQRGNAEEHLTPGKGQGVRSIPTHYSLHCV